MFWQHPKGCLVMDLRFFTKKTCQPFKHEEKISKKWKKTKKGELRDLQN
ncbi:hypothetical protein SAMN05878281_1629 [Salegentibacter salegens]|uniref:Uncharacterized protein n=1 Tax=Salegentibacter salegens TaxID=143223 RepID=A0A1M7KWS1_9FLAO|nr:hypothetical protein LY58_02244 [Salegentibacter salegens]SHM69706.1 hypothetical protein SAMN05878281_1629 [Salegentibacter salegens]